jgi:hypothetical protein
MKREFNDMGFVCEAYLQLLENAVPSHVSNICGGWFVLDLLGQKTSFYTRVKVTQVLVWIRRIRRLRANSAKSPGVLVDIPFSAYNDSLRWTLGATGMLEHSK